MKYSRWRFFTLAICCLLMMSGRSGFTQTKGSCRLIIHVDRIRNEKGVIGAALYTSADGWPEHNNKAFRHGPFPFTGSTGTMTFDGLEDRDYSVAAIHDENKNQKMDRNFLGWPLEGFGFANNPKVGLEAPSFKEASIHVSCPVTEITIHMQYK